MECQYQFLFPGRIESFDRLSNGSAINPNPCQHQFVKLLPANGSNPKALLFLEGDKSFGKQSIECLAYGTAACAKSGTQGLRRQFLTGPKFAAEYIRTEFLVHGPRQRRCEHRLIVRRVISRSRRTCSVRCLPIFLEFHKCLSICLRGFSTQTV